MPDNTVATPVAEPAPAPVTWPAGSATGVGSMPGGSIRESVQVVLDHLPRLLHLPELPARGPGAEMSGRVLGLMPDFGAEWGPTGWALTERPSRETRRAAAWLDEDLDALEELAEGWDGLVKVQLCGPWTLVATVELRSGRKALSDPGAMRDLHQAHREAVAGHVAEVAKRLPAATVIVQLDEPALPHVLDGAVPTPSGLTRLAAIDSQAVEGVLRALTGPGNVGVHCCAASPPIRLLTESGARFVSLDATLLTEADDDPVGEGLEAGVGLFLGLVPTLGALPQPATAADPVWRLWHRLGQRPEDLADIVVTPTCGLAAATPDGAAAALARCSEIAKVLSEDPEGPRG